MSDAPPAAAQRATARIGGLTKPRLAVGVAGCVLLGAALLLSSTKPPADPAISQSSSAIAPVAEPTTNGVEPTVVRETAGMTSVQAVDSRRQASVAYAQGDYATALAGLEDAVKVAPEDAEARNNLGQLLVRTGRAPEAIPHLDEAVRLDEGRWAYRFNRARAYGLVDRWPEAVADYRAAAAAFPDDHATLFNLGLALMRVDDYPGAVDALENAVAAAPDAHDFLISLGSAYIGAERPDRAQDTFGRFLALAPSSPDAGKVKALLQTLAQSRQ